MQAQTTTQQPGKLIVSETKWDQDHGPLFGGPAGTDHYRETVFVSQWEDDGSIYANRYYSLIRRTINGVTDMVTQRPSTQDEIDKYETLRHWPKCQGGPSLTGPIEGCSAPATLRMPCRSVFPSAPVCQKHAERWSNGEPMVWLETTTTWAHRDYSYIRIEGI